MSQEQTSASAGRMTIREFLNELQLAFKPEDWAITSGHLVRSLVHDTCTMSRCCPILALACHKQISSKFQRYSNGQAPDIGCELGLSYDDASCIMAAADTSRSYDDFIRKLSDLAQKRDNPPASGYSLKISA